MECVAASFFFLLYCAVPPTILTPPPTSFQRAGGLVADYYAARVDAVVAQALADAAAGQPLNSTAVARAEAAHAWAWTTANNPYPGTVTGEPAAMAAALRGKYGAVFSTC